MEYTKENESGYHFSSNPVTAPPGFAQPSFHIGDRVRLVMTKLNPMSRGEYDGATGVVIEVIFCKSDGRTILYGVEFDYPRDGATGIRCEGFELDRESAYH